MSNVEETIKERAKVYGPVNHSHKNIGLAWTSLIQQHYGITLEHPLPDYIVQLMMVSFKAQRACRVYHEDNYVDMEAYMKFANHAQSKPGVPFEEGTFIAKDVVVYCSTCKRNFQYSGPFKVVTCPTCLKSINI